MEFIETFCEFYLECHVIEMMQFWRSLEFDEDKSCIKVREKPSHRNKKRFAKRQRIRLNPNPINNLENEPLDKVQKHINRDFDTMVLILDRPREAVWDIICTHAKSKCPIVETPSPVAGVRVNGTPVANGTPVVNGTLISQYRQLQP